MPSVFILCTPYTCAKRCEFDIIINYIQIDNDYVQRKE